VVNLVAYDSKGRRLPPITLDQISDVLQQPDTFVWMGLHEPDETLLEKLQEEFGLHDLAIEDAHNAHQRPKIDVYGDSLFIVLRTAQEVNRHCEFGETHAFLGARYLVTIRHGSSLSYAPVRARVEREPELLALGPSYCFYAVFDFIVDNFMPIVEALQSELHALETAIFEHEFNREIVERLYDLKRELITLRLAIAPAQDISNQLMQSYPTIIRDEVRPYLRDVHDHVVRVKESSDAMSEMVSAAVTVNVAMVSVGQGEVVKRLAGWAALLAAPTLIASWYGMNFRHMPELQWRFSYAAVAAITAGVCVVLYRVLKRAHWL
jgi:magnesium transporter